MSLFRRPSAVARFTNPLITFVFAACLLASVNTRAETPASRIMPDGSRDLYAGLAITSGPDYAGAAERKTGGMALIQMQWSSGIFVSGLSAGWHLTEGPSVEYGPLLAIDPGRSASGSRLSNVGGISNPTIGAAGPGASGTSLPAPQIALMDDVSARPAAGGFLNYYFNQHLRLASSLLYGSGNDKHGLLFHTALQQTVADLPAHHHLSVSLGTHWANRHYMHSFFGTEATRLASGATSLAYAPSAGLRDVQLTANWNWELSPLWLLTSQVTASRLLGDAADSPLTARRTAVGLRTGLAYRF
jgi:MipA family protein